MKVKASKEDLEVTLLKIRKGSALSALRLAESKMHDYASACELGDERVWAFEMFERIRNVGRLNKG